MKRVICSMICAAVCLTSCVYPYNDFPEGDSGNLVIEGDIVLGGQSNFLLSRLMTLSESGSYKTVDDATLWVEDSDGKTYKASSSYTVDLSDADSSKEYRLRVDTSDGIRYASQWGRPEGSCEIESLDYEKDEANGQLKISVNLASDGSSSHFRYRYFEDWEYHAYEYARLYYDTAKDTVLFYKNGQNTYYCWKSNFSRGLNLATTEKMSQNRLDDYVFMTIDKSAERLSMLYRMRFEAYPVSAESYAYYENVRDNSAPTGDLFSPMPSEVRGNLRNMDDESEMVYGYVAVVTPASAVMYYDDAEELFYEAEGVTDYETVLVTPDRFSLMYSKGYLPVSYDIMKGFYWAKARCLDCRMAGGTKDRPADWPRDDK